MKSEDQGGKNSTSIDAPEGKTRDLAAKAAGFGNGKTYTIESVIDVRSQGRELVLMCRG